MREFCICTYTLHFRYRNPPRTPLVFIHAFVSIAQCTHVCFLHAPSVNRWLFPFSMGYRDLPSNIGLLPNRKLFVPVQSHCKGSQIFSSHVREDCCFQNLQRTRTPTHIVLQFRFHGRDHVVFGSFAIQESFYTPSLPHTSHSLTLVLRLLYTFHDSESSQPAPHLPSSHAHTKSL